MMHRPNWPFLVGSAGLKERTGAAAFAHVVILCASTLLSGCASETPGAGASLDGGPTSPRDAATSDAPGLPTDASGTGDAAVAAGGDGAAPRDAAADSPMGVADSGAPEAPDSGPDSTVATPPADASTDVAHTDAENDAGGNGDAGPGTPTLLLLGLASGGAFGSAFHGAAWDPVTRVATEDSYASGGGLAAAPDGRAFAAFRAEASPLLYDVIWDGSWPAPGALGVGNDDCVSAPATTAQSVFVVAAESPNTNSPGGVFLDTYDVPSPSWTDDVSVGLQGAYARPAVAANAAGEPLVVIAQSANMQGYQWTLRSGATWSTPASLPGIGASANYQFDFPVLAKRVGVDQIVGVFETTVNDMSGASLGASIFSAGAWGMPTTVATSARTGEPPSVVALADGRVALAYTSATSATIEVGFFDGTSWSAFASVPGIAPSQFFAPAIAGGIVGDVLELVYIDADDALRHVRLTNEAAWTWSAPVLVDSANAYAEVYLASL